MTLPVAFRTERNIKKAEYTFVMAKQSIVLIILLEDLFFVNNKELLIHII